MINFNRIAIIAIITWPQNWIYRVRLKFSCRFFTTLGWNKEAVVGNEWMIESVFGITFLSLVPDDYVLFTNIKGVADTSVNYQKVKVRTTSIGKKVQGCWAKVTHFWDRKKQNIQGINVLWDIKYYVNIIISYKQQQCKRVFHCVKLGDKLLSKISVALKKVD